MKRVIVLVLLLFCFRLGAYGQNEGFGLGIIAGEPTGISAKQWLSQRSAFDVGLAWSFRHEGFFHIHADYLWHFPDAVNSTERFSPYAGIGARVGVHKKDSLLGVRIVGGFAYWPRNVPLDVFVEIAPIMDLTPATELSAGGGIGIRFFFN